MRLLSIGVMCISMLMLAMASAARPSNDELKKQVAATERAFAATMKARDHAAFTSFLADEAIFLSGPTALRGRETVAKAWRKYYEGERAPFSWEPEQVEVVESGTLAYSGGPVYAHGTSTVEVPCAARNSTRTPAPLLARTGMVSRIGSETAGSGPFPGLAGECLLQGKELSGALGMARNPSPCIL